MLKCDTNGCDSEAEYWDDMDCVLCRDCMEKRVENGECPENFEQLVSSVPDWNRIPMEKLLPK